MSATHFGWILHCDGVVPAGKIYGEPYPAELCESQTGDGSMAGTWPTRKAAETHARAKGWSVNIGKAKMVLCPDCKRLGYKVRNPGQFLPAKIHRRLI